jgi:hypothetical protein
MASQACSLVQADTACETAHSREWSSRTLMIGTSTPPVSVQWVASICQRSLGRSQQKRRQDTCGRFFGSGTINPRRPRIRQIVASDGGSTKPSRTNR